MSDENLIADGPLRAWAPVRLDQDGQPVMFVRGNHGFELLCSLALALDAYHVDVLFAEVEIWGENVRMHVHGYDAPHTRLLSLHVAPTLDGAEDAAQALHAQLAEDHALPCTLLTIEQRCHAVAEAQEARERAERPLLDNGVE